MKNLVLVLTTLFSSMAFAVDTAKCPATLEVQVSQISAYKSSVYSATPGWREAQASLGANTADLTWTFNSTSKTASACFYKAATGETAKLLTSKKFDDDTGSFYDVDRLSIYFTLGGTKYSLYPLVEFTAKGVEVVPVSNGERTIIRTPLTLENNKKVNLNVGLALVEIK
jgi:hypothetical protein